MIEEMITRVSVSNMCWIKMIDRTKNAAELAKNAVGLLVLPSLLQPVASLHPSRAAHVLRHGLSSPRDQRGEKTFFLTIYYDNRDQGMFTLE